jgi:glycosyltransferase involved in cell wall biosynthesis
LEAPELSVVIPTRDRPEALARALSAALAQRDVAVEVVVVDDASEVPVAVPDDPRVRLVRTERSRGVSAARNRGLAEVRGTWVSFLDDDDLWAPDRSARMLAAARRDDADLVVAGSVVLDADGRAIDYEVRPHARNLRARLAAANALGSPSGVVVRRALLERVGGFDPAFAVLADWELWLRLTRAGRASVVPDNLNGLVVDPDEVPVLQTHRAMHEFAELNIRSAAAVRAGDRPMNDALVTRWASRTHRRAGRRIAAARLSWRAWRRHGKSRDLLRAAGSLAGEPALRRLGVDATHRRAPLPPAWVARFRTGPGGTLGPLRG